MVLVRAIAQQRKLRRRNSKGSENKGYGAKGEETPEKPYPREKLRNRGTKKSEKGRINARNINRPRQLYQYKSSRGRAIDEEKPYL